MTTLRARPVAADGSPAARAAAATIAAMTTYEFLQWLTLAGVIAVLVAVLVRPRI